MTCLKQMVIITDNTRKISWEEVRQASLVLVKIKDKDQYTVWKNRYGKYGQTISKTEMKCLSKYIGLSSLLQHFATERSK